jgi:hypothetical protein
VEVREEQVKKSYREAVQDLDLKQTETPRERSVLLIKSSIGTEIEVQDELV